MRPTHWSTLVALAIVTGGLGWVLANSAYGDLAALPLGAPFTALVIALFELGLARVVSRKIRGLAPGKPMHPLQIARALVLAKASSATGALLLGFYGGFFVWVVGRTDLKAAHHDVWVSATSVAACLALIVAALFLERACRTPSRRDEMQP